MGTTANYSWPYPESTDFVADGATAIENLADAADATVYANRGLKWLSTHNLSGATNDLTGVFSAAHVNYRIIIENLSFGGAGALVMRMLASGVAATTTHYWGYNGYLATPAGFDSGGSSATGAYAGIQTNVGGVPWGTLVIDLHQPFASNRTVGHHQGAFYNGNYYGMAGSSILDNNTSYDGIRFYSTVSLGGKVTIYGYIP